GGHHDNTTIFAATLAEYPTLVFEAVEDAHHSTWTDVDLATDSGSGERPVLGNGAQAHQLRCRNVAICGELTGMKRNGASDTPQRPQDAQVVMRRGILRNHHLPEKVKLQGVQESLVHELSLFEVKWY